MKVSVIIPFYNLERYVRPCLDSVVSAVANAPVGLALEVICVDDGSTDGTGALLDAAGTAFNFQPPAFSLKVIHKPNGGEGSARNAGLRAATGEWVAFLDGDDVWLPTMLSEFAAVENRHVEADIIGFRYLPFDDGQLPPAPQSPSGSEVLFDLRGKIPSEAILDLGVFPTFFRRERFRDVAFSTLPLGADRLYVAQCLSEADRIVMSPAVVHGYRIRAGSMARAVWNERKIKSMVDFAAGSLAAFSASDRRIGRRGARYLGDVLLSVTPKQLRRMEGDDTEARRYWRESLATVDGSLLSPVRRIRRWWFCRGWRRI